MTENNYIFEEIDTSDFKKYRYGRKYKYLVAERRKRTNAESVATF
jgi:hypothetical protein